MPITSPQWRFTAAMIHDAPDMPGVYVLWREGTPLGVGHAVGGRDTIRSRLLSHAASNNLKEVTHYSWQMSREPARLAAETKAQLSLAERETAKAQSQHAEAQEEPCARP